MPFKLFAPALVALVFSTAIATAAPVAYTVFLDADAGEDGGGTIVFDESLLTPGGLVLFSEITADIAFRGVVYDTIFDPLEEFILGEEGVTFVSTTNRGAVTEFLDAPTGQFTSILAALNGAMPYRFRITGLGEVGSFSITAPEGVEAAAVPLPAGALLLGAGLLGAGLAGFGALRRRRG